MTEGTGTGGRTGRDVRTGTGGRTSRDGRTGTDGRTGADGRTAPQPVPAAQVGQAPPDPRHPAEVARLEALPVTPPLAHHGEGPVWDSAEGALRWVDMLRGDLLSWTPPAGWDATPVTAADVRRDHLGDVLACVRPRTSGGFVVALERRLGLLGPGDLGRVPPELLPEVWADPGVRFNEGGCDPQGRFYCGSMAYDQAEGGATLYRLDPDRSVHVVMEGLTVSNGLGWAPDGSVAYYHDTPTQTISTLVLDGAGDVREREVLRRVPDEHGGPDGLAVDADGCLWAALFGGSAVHRISAQGDLLAVVDVGAEQVTACAFGGPDLADLFITTSADGVAEGDDPLAGSLFHVRPGVRGLPVLPFAG